MEGGYIISYKENEEKEKEIKRDTLRKIGRDTEWDTERGRGDTGTQMGGRDRKREGERHKEGVARKANMGEKGERDRARC